METPSVRPRGLFLNPKEPTCSIYESGRMSFDCLRRSERFSIEYQEIDAQHRNLPGGYDFYVFNYHDVTMAWLDLGRLGRLSAPKITLVLEVLPNDPFSRCPPGVFDAYCALDPTMRSRDPRVYAFPRPLEVDPATPPTTVPEADTPIIGSFGFATSGKGFERVVRAVNEEFGRAVIRLNIPHGAHTDPSREYAAKLADNCRRLARDGVRVDVTHDFMSKAELIAWCRTNTLNCFLYDRNVPGLSATTDQAITSGRPLAVSANSTFRHIIDYVTPYPLRSLRESIDSSVAEVQRMQHDWAPAQFTAKFEQVLDDLGLLAGRSAAPAPAAAIRLPETTWFSSQVARVQRVARRFGANDLIPPLLGKGTRRLLRAIRKTPPPQARLPVFAHAAFGSFSQFHEDLLIDLILGGRAEGSYIDVGANDPEFNSNTLRFYKRGWSGVCVEPGAEAFRRIAAARPKDTNLNIAVGPERGKMTFFRVVDDSTLSSLDEASARRMAAQVGSSVVADEVEVWPLRDVFAQHMGTRRVDFLSVDAEGYDLTVLQSNDWEQYRPTLVLVEINSQFEAIVALLASHNYLLIFNNPDNGLFIDKHTNDAGVRAALGGAPLI